MRDLDIAYKIETIDITGDFFDYYFEKKENAIKFVKKEIEEEYIID